MANERARGLGYKYITDDKYLVNPFSPTEGISYEGDGSPVSYANSGIMSQSPIPAPLKYIPREGGGDGRVDLGPKDYGYTGPGSTGSVGGFNIDDIGEGTIDDEDLDTPGMSKIGAAKTLGSFAFMGPLAGIFSAYRNNQKEKQKEIDKINEKINKQYGYNTQSNDGSGLNDGPDGGYTGSGNEGVSKSDPTHSDNYDMKNGGRAGYFFGGRVNYKAGGRINFRGGGMDMGNEANQAQSAAMGNNTSAPGPGDTGGEGGNNPRDGSDTQFGDGNNNNNNGNERTTFFQKIKNNRIINNPLTRLVGRVGMYSVNPSLMGLDYRTASQLKGVYDKATDKVDEDDVTLNKYKQGGRVSFKNGGLASIL